jgi:hypothetical protein
MEAQIPLPITGVVLLTDLIIAVLIVVGSIRAARRAGLSSSVQKRVRTAAAGVMVVWLLLAFAVAQVKLPPLHPLVLGMIGGPIVVGYSLLLVSPTWRQIVGAVPQTWLVGGQVYRTIGAVFLLLWGLGELPAFFAIPAGVGDIITGVGALLVAGLIVKEARGWQAATVGWNIFGVLDLVIAVGAGSTLLAGPLSFMFAAETSTEIITQFPLGMIPMFLVPISIVLHLYSLTNLYTEPSVARTSPDTSSRTEG